MRPSEPGQLRSVCVRCDETLTIKLPMRMSEVAAMTKAFIRLHRPCAVALANEQAGAA